jgi:hypothetical protein
MARSVWRGRITAKCRWRSVAPAVLRTAEFPGHAAPYFLQLVASQGAQARDGRWLALEIHGWFANRDRRWLGDLIVRSIDFAPPYDRPVKPRAPRRVPPNISASGP